MKGHNKSLHPTGSSVTPGAISCHALAPGAPAAPAGELNRYTWVKNAEIVGAQ